MPRRKRVSTVQPLLLTIPDVAILLGVSRGTVYNLMYHQGLPTVKFSGMKRVHPDSLQKWLKEREQQAV